MVIVMQSKNINHCIHDYIHKPRRDSAQSLHRFYNKNASPVRIPTASELILERLQFAKWCSIEYDFCGGIDEDVELQELCQAINIDWNDIDASVIDEKWNRKQRNIC